MDLIDVPVPEMARYQRVQIATENAFNELIRSASQQGLELNPVMGLVYLPNMQHTTDFIKACWAIIASLEKP